MRALITTRGGGVSSGKFASLNLSTRVGDDPRCVARNRAILRACLPAEPAWMKQVHGTAVIDATRATPELTPPPRVVMSARTRLPAGQSGMIQSG